MASRSKLAIWSCLLLLATTTARALSVPNVKARNDDWDDDDWSDEDGGNKDLDNHDDNSKWHSGVKKYSPVWHANGARYEVHVGPHGKLMYDPPFVHAKPGDKIKFIFNPKNHTVTQSSFEDPCTSNGGFKTGFVPVAPGTHPLPHREFIVPQGHHGPLWFYCGQVNHCQSGMVFAINPPHPPAHNSFEKFKEKAMHSKKHHMNTDLDSSEDWDDSYEDNETEDDSEDNWDLDHHEGQMHNVYVGPDGQLVYSPHNVHAKIGDTIRFHFNPKNHTVTQSSFEHPCSPLEHGFKTGFVPVEPGTNPLPYKDLRVERDGPMWFYCGQVNHCQSGMVFAINAPHPPSDKSFDAFKARAIESGKKAEEKPVWEHKSAVHNVYVGPDGQLVYSPHNVHAKVGDTIRFHFNPKNHTVTQSSFENPCSAIDGGFKTGFVPVEPGTHPLPYREFVVPESHGKPLWFYCGQVNHCQSGMVFSINAPHPPAHNSFDAFKAKAIESGKNQGKHHEEKPAWEHKPHHNPTVHDVQVGPHGKLVYEPPYVHAKPGDTVRFHFNPKNHTVTQSAFDSPCMPLADGWGFKTGFVPVQPGTHPLPTKDFVVPEGGHPLWFYCGQVNHCPSGMVFAINPPAPPSHMTFDTFKANAMATAKMHHNNMPSGGNYGDEDWDNDEDLDAVSDNAELDATSVSSTGETLKKYAVAGLALLGLNALLALGAIIVGVMIYVKKNGSPKVATVGAGRYTPVFDADKS